MARNREQEEELRKLKAEERKRNYTSDGRYIPYSGGSAGWDENTGVMRREQANNYNFQTVVTSEEVRRIQFYRASDGFDRRKGKERFYKVTAVEVAWEGGFVDGQTRDISLQGMSLQFVDEITLQKGQEVEVRLKGEKNAPAMSIRAVVMWNGQTGGPRRPLWSLGIAFLHIDPLQSDQLKTYLSR